MENLGEPLTMGDEDMHCSPECPFLSVSSEQPYMGVCLKDKKPLDYYDWYIAHCNDQSQE